VGESDSQRGPGLLARLALGPVVCAEGYVFELERRGYLQAGAFVPEVVLDHPEAVLQLHRDFAHAGSDVVEALTYYAHREKLRIIGKEHLLEQMNRQALALARQVAAETGTLLGGDICNTNVFLGDAETAQATRAMFEEQVGWAVDAGVDLVIAETFSYADEALIATDVIKQAGLPAVVTMMISKDGQTREGWTPAEACARLEDAGADVVGLNCGRGPRTMLPLLGEIRQAVRGYVAALPVPYRTTDEEPTFQSLREHSSTAAPGGMPFPTALDPFTCTRYEMAEFARQALALDVRYLGICCGAGPHHIRALAEAVGKTPPASRYSADMSKHAYFGTDPRVKQENQQFAQRL
jgi:betaine-homocysteine S-methyltransferase